jgi:citrate lyase subunit beta-like protein
VNCLAYDLEDSVTPSQKIEARKLVRYALDQPIPSAIVERAVRINSVDSGLALADLEELVSCPNLTTLLVPKVDSASDLTFVSDVVAHIRGKNESNLPPVSVLALIESAKSLSSLQSICTAAPHLLSGLVFASEDFALDMSLTRTPSLTEFLYARSLITTAARAYSLHSTIDLVCTAFRSEADQQALENECRDGANMGFSGKQCIHPSQVETVSRYFTPGQAELQWAIRVQIAARRAEAQARGAWTLDGKMIDAPVEEKARVIVQKAQLCGMDVAELQIEYRDVQPE